MTHTNKVQDIDEILSQTFAYGVDWTEYKYVSEYDHKTSLFAAKIKAQQKEALKQAITQLISSCIPEMEKDERYYKENAPVTEIAWRRGHNAARDTIITNLKEKGIEI